MCKRILLIEDDPLWEDAIVRFAEDSGYKIEVARTADEARSKLGLTGKEVAEANFDLLIVDIRIPSDHEGLQIIKELRHKQNRLAIAQERGPRVIMSSVLDKIAVAEWEAEVKWDRFLVKPYDLKELLKIIGSFFC